MKGIWPESIVATKCLFFLLALAIGGCTIYTKSPPAPVTRAEKSLYSENLLRDSHAAFAKHFIGLTISGSYSHIPGKEKGLMEAEKLVKLNAKENYPHIIFDTANSDCHIDSRLADELGYVTDSVFNAANDRENLGDINVRISLLPVGQGISRKIYNLRLGSSVDLNFYFSCSIEHSRRDIFLSYVEAMHELAHVISDTGNYTQDSQERYAEGLPACIFETLKKEGDDLGLLQILAEDDYFSSRAELKFSGKISTENWCRSWIRLMRSDESNSGLYTRHK